MSEPAHLRVYRFGAGASFEGGLLAALERMELGSEAALLDALFVLRDAADNVEAVDLRTGRADGTFASLLDFRLGTRRRALTERTLAEHPDGVPRTLIEAVAATLEPGAAVLAVLLAGPPAPVLDDAVARSGGRLIADEPVQSGTLAEAGAVLRAATGADA